MTKLLSILNGQRHRHLKQENIKAQLEWEFLVSVYREKSQSARRPLHALRYSVKLIQSFFATHWDFSSVRFSGFRLSVIAHDAIARRKNVRPGTPRQMPVLTRTIRIEHLRLSHLQP